MEQFHFDPKTYPAMVSAEVSAYDQLQNEVAAGAKSRTGTHRPI
ncbi:hypothetical protein [Candidatus Protofrankia californiensis]|nr:hypothetical protein [Candidatus Protofrankia californiensis]